MRTIDTCQRANCLQGFAAIRRAPVIGVVAIAVAACGSSTGVQTIANPDDPTEVELFNFLAQNVRTPAAFDIVSGSTVRLASNARWDFIFELAPNGTARLKPRGMFIDESSDAGLIRQSVTFDEVTSAPRNGYTRFAPTVIDEGDVLAMRSQRDAVVEPIRCLRYGKIEVLSIDRTEGTLTFKHLINPNCENRNLVPGAAVPLEDQD